VQWRGVGFDGAGEPRLVLPAFIDVPDEAGEQQVAAAAHDLFHGGRQVIMGCAIAWK
jgi:hypothetical protein